MFDAYITIENGKNKMIPICASCRGPSDNGTNYCSLCTPGNHQSSFSYGDWIHPPSGSATKEIKELINALELNKITQEAIKIQMSLKWK